MKKILIALDYNPTAQRVAEAGYALAKAMNAKTILLHVISDINYYSSLSYSPVMGFGGFSNVDTTQLDTIGEIRIAAKAYLDKSKQHLGDESIQTLVKTGDFGETILTSANELDVDIIVMGTHSRRGLEKIFVVSVADNVLHHSRIPLFIIPTKDNDERE
jgi:nucleotide-binding universal stress UspA family protein